MGAPPEVLVHRDAALLARTVAARLVASVQDAQAARGEASLVLTGGGIGIASLRALRESPARDAIDWARLDVWWGDERFVPADHDDRNDKQARAALLDHVPLDPERVFPVCYAGMPGVDAAAAASRYAAELAAKAPGGAAVPAFDILLLGLGPDGHVASLFPGAPTLEEKQPVVAVFDSPKPPPVRVTLTLPAIRSAREVWVIAAGEEKAEAVHKALAAQFSGIPASDALGRVRTLWLLDRAAASRLPAH
jgi:6-phosphogluconolactonase